MPAAPNRQGVAVLILVENLPVPFNRRVWQEARALTQAGYRVSIISPKGPGFEASHEVREGIEIYRHRVWEASGALAYLLEYGWALTAEFYLALKVYARTRFRVLQVGNPPDLFFGMGWFFKLFGVRFIFEFLDLNPELYVAKFGKRGAFHRLLCLAEKLSFRAADVTIAANQSYRDIAVERGGVAPERVFVVRGTIDLTGIRGACPRPELKECKAHLVVYLGVMGPQDGLDLLLESIEHIVKTGRRNDTLFVLIGGGTELPALKAAATSKGLDAWVRFTGRLPEDQVAAYLATADIGVAPDPKNDMNDKSSMTKILDYMAHGKPTVLFDLTEGRRSAEESALYARPNDPIDFAEQILRLLDSESLRRKLGDAGRHRIEELMSWEFSKRALIAAYETALS